MPEYPIIKISRKAEKVGNAGNVDQNNVTPIMQKRKLQKVHTKNAKKKHKMPKIHKQCKNRYIVSLCRNYYNAVRGGQWRIVEDMHVL